MEAAGYIAADSPVYADAFVTHVLEKASGLSKFPRMGHNVPEIDHGEFRELAIQQYRLIYQVRPDDVLILGLIHGARDFASAWHERNPQQD